jgi:hypothetical protein
MLFSGRERKKERKRERGGEIGRGGRDMYIYEVGLLIHDIGFKAMEYHFNESSCINFYIRHLEL